MESNEQLGLDFEVERTAWGTWVDPDRRAAQVRKFLDYAGLGGIPAGPWPEGSSEVKRLDAALAEWLPDMDAAMKPENHDLVDAFVCFMGECFIRFAGARWVDWHSWDDENSFYDHVNPAVECDTSDEDELGMWVLVKDMQKYDPEVDDGMFSYFASALREYSGYHDDKRREEASSTE
ncbi:hypothetical protein IU449_05615 [Nocardia higoensis]|uniref:Uncharacterized protein n=1 Tax=Nocardia higoensis TaxID=228599 RepID=A0ABS0D894_9NOCA|nr:hypothetical protein [Nocardia higoensis]MBF6354033.1 hypothetical protein [Nocardia higoensis]